MKKISILTPDILLNSMPWIHGPEINDFGPVSERGNFKNSDHEQKKLKSRTKKSTFGLDPTKKNFEISA